MPDNFGQLLLQQLCTRRDTTAMAFGPLDALLVPAELFPCFRCRIGTPGSCSGLRWGRDIITAQTATRDASHGGRGDPGKWDRCLRSAVGLGSGHFFCLREGPTANANHSGRVCARIMCREKTQEGHRCPPISTRFTRRGPAAANGSSSMPRNRVSVKEDYYVAKNSEEIRACDAAAFHGWGLCTGG